jgi:hypothetical protein
MSPKDDHLMGITPILLRRAAHYLKLGIGEYTPVHPHFDKVTVIPVYELLQNPLEASEWALGLRVSFFKNEHCIRWVEFSCRTVGAGGDYILRKVEDV